MRRTGLMLVLAVGFVSAVGAAGDGRDGAFLGARPAPRLAVRSSSAFQLIPRATTALLNVNRVECVVNAQGEQCSDANNSSVYGGGFWPAGSPDQYIFNGGMQLAALLLGDRAAFPWAGDTVGAFVFDARGDQQMSTAVSGVWNSRRETDLKSWPSAAYVGDPALFDASLLGVPAASEQDSWARYWDVNTWGQQRRPHPMGLLVDQRTLAWNSPLANRDILYVIHRLINISSRDPSRYAGLAAAGYSAEDIAEIAHLGAQFQDSAEAAYHVSIPDSGFTWTQLYVAMGQDPDVGNAGSNYSTAILPFATAIAYQSSFNQPTWAYPPDVFGPPFAAAPGFVGTKFLTAANGSVTSGAAVTMFTNTTGGAPLPDRVGVAALWRLLANRLAANDGWCNVPAGRQVCMQVQVYADTRWFQSTGPFPDVRAGESVVFAIAYVFAAPVAAELTVPGSYPDYKPGIPGTGSRLVAGTDTVRRIERIAGWQSFQDANGDGDLQAREVRTVPYSLLHKAAVAQAFFDNRFLSPAAPPAPRVAVLPGDGQATVVWERSAAEATGDPYFPVASDPLSPLYDPNFRQFDVEGYRVWRGRSLASMEVVAQFDYAGTRLTDYTGQVFGWGEQVGQCAPDVGVLTDCRADFAHGRSRTIPLNGTVMQIPPNGRIVLADGRVVVLRADTVVTGGGSGFGTLQDNGVPFAFVDAGLQNGTTYVYAVTAFDVNSINAGVTTRESALVGRTVTPRAASSNAVGAAYEITVVGGDGARLRPDRKFPTIDPLTGTFSGPIPPANGATLTLGTVVEQLLPAGEFSLRLDSIGPGFAVGTGNGSLPRMYFSVPGGPASAQGSTEVSIEYSGHLESYSSYAYSGPLVLFDSLRAARFGVGFDSRMQATLNGRAPNWTGNSLGVSRAAYNSAVAAPSRWLAHSRWFDGDGAEPPDPTIDPYGTAGHTNGALSGVMAIYSPIAYRLPLSGGAAVRAIPSRYREYVHATYAAWYPADFVVHWESGGRITVRDSTHRIDLPFKRAVQPGFGFLNASAIVAAGVTGSQLSDGAAGVTFDPAVVSYYSLRTVTPACLVTTLASPCVPLEETARLQPIDITNDGRSDGTGIALIVNGEPFFFLMSALPAEGTTWRLRAVGGGAMNATCTPTLPGAGGDIALTARPSDCYDYTYTPPAVRPAFAPGLRFTVSIRRQAGADSTRGSLAGVHPVPDPLYFSNATGVAPSIRFVGLPERAIVRIYSASGILVTVLTHNDPTAGGELVWDVRHRGGGYVASGLYFYHVEAPDHRTKIGRLTIVQQAWP